MLALYDPEVEWDASRVAVATGGGGVYRGHEGVRSFFREYYEAWETLDNDCKELIAAGEHVVSVSNQRGRGRASGIEVEWSQYAVWTIREGKIVRVAWFPSRGEALEAAGLQE